jgi:TRAP-type C4-dicarboxylate transport system substrate-binding protein
VGAIPVGMPLPQIPDALSKGTIDACVIPWEVVPSVKVHELTKFHSEFDNTGGALYTTTFVMAMNKAKYDSLAPDLKKVIDANSGLATSAWLGKTQQGNDVPGRKTAVDRGNTIYQITRRRRARAVPSSCPARSTTNGWPTWTSAASRARSCWPAAKALIAKHGKA